MSQGNFEYFNRATKALRTLRSVAEHPLHRGRPLSGVARWLRLKLAQRLTPTRQITIPYVGGAVLAWSEPLANIGLCARYGLSEYADMVFSLHLLRPGDLFCDVGANAGAYTVLAARAVGSSVIAMEPVPKTFDVLMQNVHLNGISERVEARRIGVGREAASLQFTTTLLGANHVVSQAAENTVDAEVLPLDSILGDRVPLMIKIDVEGFESEVLAGASRTLRSSGRKAVLIEMWAAHAARYGARLDDLARVLIDSGLSGPYWYDPIERRLIEPGRAEWEKYNYNQIFVRDIEFVKNRLSNAKKYEVNGVEV